MAQIVPRPLFLVLYTFLGVSLGGALPEPSDAQTLNVAGKAAAVSTDTQGKVLAQPIRTMAAGGEVWEQELLTTGPAGPAQLLFLDGSSAVVGPNGSLTVDRFVYDGVAAHGKLTMSLASGAMRFVGGRVSKSDMAEIKTPTATVGIRGGVALVWFSPASGDTFALKQYGDEMRVTGPDGVTRVVTANGFGVLTSRLATGRIEKSSSGEIDVLHRLVSGSVVIADASGRLTDADIDGVSRVNSDLGPPTTTAQWSPPADADVVLEIVPLAIPQPIVAPTIIVTPPLAFSPSLRLVAVIVTPSGGGPGDFQTPAASAVYGADHLADSVFVATGSHAGTYGVGTTTNFEAGGDTFIQWARWASGTTTGVSAATYSATQGAHMLLAIPTASLAVHSPGLVTYSLLGATKPTYADGFGTPGTYSGTFTVTFTGGPSANYTSTGVIAMSDGTYTYSLAGSTTSAGFHNSAHVSGAGRACNGVCGANSAFSYSGAIAGPSADHVGLSYKILPTNGAASGTKIAGVAAFKH
jgi:hypothetical protein